jgi:hypothetical protein
MVSKRRYIRSNTDPECTPLYSNPKNIMTRRNLREHQVSSPPGNPNLRASHSVVHVGSEYFDLVDIFIYYISTSKLPPEPLIDLWNSPLGFYEEVSSSFKPFLKNPIIPPSVEFHNIILQNPMANLEGERVGRNQPLPPPLNPWIMAQFVPLNLPSHVHDIPENYLKLLPEYNGEPSLSPKEHLASF